MLQLLVAAQTNAIQFINEPDLSPKLLPIWTNTLRSGGNISWNWKVTIIIFPRPCCIVLTLLYLCRSFLSFKFIAGWWKHYNRYTIIIVIICISSNTKMTITIPLCVSLSQIFLSSSLYRYSFYLSFSVSLFYLSFYVCLFALSHTCLCLVFFLSWEVVQNIHEFLKFYNSIPGPNLT